MFIRVKISNKLPLAYFGYLVITVTSIIYYFGPSLNHYYELQVVFKLEGIGCEI